jgi:hypothetical protein
MRSWIPEMVWIMDPGYLDMRDGLDHGSRYLGMEGSEESMVVDHGSTQEHVEQ